jgi:glycerol-3-phosphate O-acyltransferase
MREAAPFDHDVLVLSAVRTPVERDLVRAHEEQLAATTGGRVEMLPLPSTSGGLSEFEELAERLSAPGSDDLLLVPAHVLWRPGEKDGRRRARISDVVRGHNPYRPALRHQRQIARKHPDMCPVVEADGATVAEMRAKYAEATTGGSDLDFARFVARRAVLALERAEHAMLGPQFKAPRLVKEEIFHSARFQEGLAALRDKVGPGHASAEAALEMLEELATGWGRMFVDVLPRTGRFVFERGFDPVIDIDQEEIERMRALQERLPAIMLWSHRSNLDNQVLTVAMHENGLPKTHTFAGINMAFGPMGPIFRRAGIIFIRRHIGDDPLYKYVLREYVGYLVEKRFNLSWSIEGTRSRTGKMLPPKLGLLNYVAEAYLSGRSDDIALQPVSISFDQLHEISEYAEYARGSTKKSEGFTWLLDFVRAQGNRHYGKVYIRFPEAVSMRAFLGPPNGPIAADRAARHLALQKMAFEVAWRINWATPVTPTALVTSMLLGTRGAGMTTGEVHRALVDVLRYLDDLDVPRAASVEALHALEGVRGTLEALAGGGPVTKVSGGREDVWLIGPEDQLPAAFYRNSIVHVFLNGAICEIAMLGAADAREGAAVATFWETAFRLRDLLKFEFYFEERDLFHTRLATEMERFGQDWETRLGQGKVEIHLLLSEHLPLTAQVMLRPFFEAYALVADVLAQDPDIARDEVLPRALALGRQYVAQRRIGSEEPVSTLLFATALQVAEARGLLAEDAASARQTFLEELQMVLARIDEIEALASRVFFDRGRG